jgi:hypothetical protein
MPKTQEILSGLHTIANDFTLYAVIWHMMFYLFIFALLLKWQPSNRIVAVMICLPLVSVAIFAWITGNPFNGIMFSALAALILVFGLKTNVSPVNPAQLPFIIAGIVMIAFGLIYPHFLETTSVLKYAYASPAGLIPCPTLSILIGFALLFGGFGSQTVVWTLIVFGLFYGIFGVIKLGVYIDLFLIGGALTLFAGNILRR